MRTQEHPWRLVSTDICMKRLVLGLIPCLLFWSQTSLTLAAVAEPERAHARGEEL